MPHKQVPLSTTSSTGGCPLHHLEYGLPPRKPILRLLQKCLLRGLHYRNQDLQYRNQGLQYRNHYSLRGLQYRNQDLLLR